MEAHTGSQPAFRIAESQGSAPVQTLLCSTISPRRSFQRGSVPLHHLQRLKGTCPAHVRQIAQARLLRNRDETHRCQACEDPAIQRLASSLPPSEEFARSFLLLQQV